MKKYIFEEIDDKGNKIRQIESNTLKQMSRETNITISSLHRIKSNKTQNKKKGKFIHCSIKVHEKEFSPVQI